MIGSNVGGYVVLNRIGAGAMGEVYLAQHRRLERRAAIKILLPGLSKDPDLVSRFFNEARALSRIQHPGIVEVYDCDLLDDRAFIVMEYLEGESMATVLERTGSVAGEAASVAAVTGQIAVALAAAHDKGIVHRDLKPENVYFSLGRQAPFAVKVLDFGIAKLATDNFGGVSQTRPGSLLGTPAYMSPEQCRGVASIDHRADIYAMGCMVFEMLTGRHVFQMEHFGDLIVAHIGTPAPRASTLVPGVPTDLDELVARMLAKSPDERPQSMNDVIVAMEKFLNLSASAFGQAIPPTSRMVPQVIARAVPPTQAMAAFATGAGSGARTGAGTATGASAEANTGDGSSMRRRPQALPVAAPGPIAGAPGGTQVLPDTERDHRLGASADATAPNESTFRRSASEMIAPPLDQRRGPLKFVAGVLGLGAAIAAALVFFAGPGKPRTDEAPPSAASPGAAPPNEVKPPEPAPPPPPVAVPPPPESPPPEPAADAPVEPPSGVQPHRAVAHEDHAPSSKSPSQKPGRKASKNHGARDSDGKNEIKNARPHPKEAGAGKPADYYHPVGD